MNGFDVYYMTPEGWEAKRTNFSNDTKFAQASLNMIIEDGVSPWHTFLLAVQDENIDDVFYHMQGEIWSPNGEARDLLSSLGLQHTSMSTGDMLRDNLTGQWYTPEFVGWAELNS